MRSPLGIIGSKFAMARSMKQTRWSYRSPKTAAAAILLATLYHAADVPHLADGVSIDEARRTDGGSDGSSNKNGDFVTARESRSQSQA